MLIDVITEELRALRAKKNYSQEEVAEKLGVHRETFRKYESNPSIMNVGLFLEMLGIYDTNPSIFFDNVMANCQKNKWIKGE